MKRLGYYAKDKDGNLFQYQWGKDDTFQIVVGDIFEDADPNDYEVLELFYSEN